MTRHSLEVETEVLDAIAKAVSVSRDAALKKVRRLQTEKGAPQRTRENAEEEFRLLTAAQSDIDAAQARSLSE